MNKIDLFEAIGGIDSSLLERCETDAWNDNEPIAAAAIPQKGITKGVRFSVISSIAACIVMVISVFAVKQNHLWNPSPLLETSSANVERTSSKSEERSELQSENVLSTTSQNNAQIYAPESAPSESKSSICNTVGEESIEVQSPTAISSRPQVHDRNIPVLKVWNHRLYSKKAIPLKESDLDKRYSEMEDDSESTIYSIKGKSIEECFAWKANSGIYFYECIDDGMITINDNTYGLIEKSDSFPKKGKFLGEFEGKKVYEIDGNSQAVLVDMQTVIKGGEKEQLYVAERMK